METPAKYEVNVVDSMLLDTADVTEQETQWSITDKASADWALDKIRQAQIEIASNIDTAKKIMEAKQKEVDEWLVTENSSLESTIAFFTGHLEKWTDDELAKVNDGKKKPTHSIKLPCGTVSFKKASDKFFVGGKPCDAKNEALLSLLQNSYPEFVKTTTTYAPQWAEFKKTLRVDNGKVVSADGEVMDIDFIEGKYEFKLPNFKF